MDLVSALSSAVNLMDLNPWEFEELVAISLAKVGLKATSHAHRAMAALIV
jgi:hypothetical protein